MLRRVQRYEIPRTVGAPFVLPMHVGRVILSFQSVPVAGTSDETAIEKLVLWALSRADTAPRDWLFILVETGGEVPDGATYVGTAQTKFQDVHLFVLSSFDSVEP